MNIKLLIVDDHPLLLKGLRDALALNFQTSTILDAHTGAQAIQAVRESAPDLVIMDLRLPDMTGGEATRQIVKLSPSAKVLIFSCEMSRPCVDEALEAGAAGYVPKSSALQELVGAIASIMQGKLYLSPQVSGGILEEYRHTLVHGPEIAKPAHSEREKLLLRLVAEGRRNKEIASELAVSTKSVETYRSRLMKKLHCSNTAELVRYAIREGIAKL